MCGGERRKHWLVNRRTTLHVMGLGPKCSGAPEQYSYAAAIGITSPKGAE